MGQRLQKQKKQTWARRLWKKTGVLHSTDALYFCSLLILLFFAATITVASLMHIAHIVIGVWTAPLAMALTIGVYFALGNWRLTPQMQYGLYTFLIALVTLTLLCGFFYEISWDGNAYHKPTVGALANGWNPVYESINDYMQRADLLDMPASAAIWGDHYAKAAWLYAASIYAVTGNIECGKASTLLVVLALFGMAHHYLRARREFTSRQAITLAALTAVNPVSLPQLLTYMNDGLLCSTLFLCILGLTTLTDHSYTAPKRMQWTMVVCAILICCNVKFTGLAYAGVFCVLFYFLHILREKKGLRFRKGAKLFILYGVTFCFAVFLVGASTYVKNTVDHQHPFYPLMGEGAVDIIYTNQPDSFNEMSTAEKLFRSTFSQTANLTRRMQREPQLKIPFVVYPQELAASGATDTRISGFGPWFSGILLVSLVLLALALVRLFRQKRFAFYLLAGNLLLIFVLLFSLSDSWWARYSPFFYLLVLVAYAVGCVRLRREPNKKNRWLVKLMTIALICNTAFFSPALLRNVGTVMVHVQNVAIKKEAEPVVLYFDTYHKYTGVYYNLQDLGVDVVIAKEPPETGKYYYMLTTQYESHESDGALMQWIEEFVEQFAP